MNPVLLVAAAAGLLAANVGYAESDTDLAKAKASDAEPETLVQFVVSQK